MLQALLTTVRGRVKGKRLSADGRSFLLLGKNLPKKSGDFIVLGEVSFNPRLEIRVKQWVEIP